MRAIYNNIKLPSGDRSAIECYVGLRFQYYN